MTEALKPCPFCGSKRVNLDAEIQGGYYVECQDCWASLSWSYQTEKEAAQAWNTRACQHGTWLRSDEEGNVWQCSVCGNEWQLMDGTPEENHMNYCQQCGASMSAQAAKECWILHEENTGWECPRCHAVIELDKGNPKDKYVNYCPVCGTKLELPE